MRRFEHLVLNRKQGFTGYGEYFTEWHPNPGKDLQRALFALQEEGWEVICSYKEHAEMTRILLKRPYVPQGGQDQ